MELDYFGLRIADFGFQNAKSATEIRINISQFEIRNSKLSPYALCSMLFAYLILVLYLAPYAVGREPFMKLHLPGPRGWFPSHLLCRDVQEANPLHHPQRFWESGENESDL